MMKRVYCIKDVIAEEFADSFFFCNNDGVATRIFNETLKKVPEPVQKDLHLYCLGKFYSDTGKIFSEVTEVVPTDVGATLDDVVEDVTTKELFDEK